MPEAREPRGSVFLHRLGGSDAVALIGGLLNDPQVNLLIHEEAASALGSVGE
jgi:hypothetical protein